MIGVRTTDIRSNYDRVYNVGDVLELHEWCPINNIYTGRVCKCDVTYIQNNNGNPCAVSHDAIRDGFVVMSIKLFDFTSTRDSNLPYFKDSTCQD